ncbi:hypothetical protein [Immundisolibacter sp.]|uniref:hypothetical protein n=1 Tax=Immundisolibacter sp. TaxID=1934948 RepID=UPI003568D70D
MTSGFLLSSFLSPVSNLRDTHGGKLARHTAGPARTARTARTAREHAAVALCTGDLATTAEPAKHVPRAHADAWPPSYQRACPS